MSSPKSKPAPPALAAPAPDSAQGTRLVLAGGLLAASGLASLVYEVLWSRMLVLVLGNTTLATSSILATVMTGLSLGSALGGRWAERWPGQLLRRFAALEATTAIYALLFPVLLRLLAPIERLLADQTDPAQIALRLLLCLLLLCLPTLCMGAGFALLARWAVVSGSFGRHTALLYGVNTAGAVLGAGLAGFVLVRLLGHSATLAVAAALNLLLATVAWHAARRGSEALPLSSGRRPPSRKRMETGRPAAHVRVLIFSSVFVTGFCALAWQVLWTRLMILVADNSVYSFSVILMLFLAGTALGSLLLAPLLRGSAHALLALSAVLIGAGFTAMLVPLQVTLRSVDPATAYLVAVLLKLPLLALLPTALIGAALPLAAILLRGAQGAIGSILGRVWAVNTLGGACGALAAPFLLIERLGFRHGSLLLSALLVGVGGLLLASRYHRPIAVPLVLAASALAAGGWLIIPPDHFARTYGQLEPRSQLVEYHEGLAATTCVFERSEGSRVLYVNGMPEVDTSPASLRTLKLLGALPGLLHPHPERALMITFGAGISAGISALLSPRIECVDLIDRLPQIAARFADWNGGILGTRPLTTHSDDARHFLQRSGQRYDLIVSDATHPRSYDSWVLFTAEFYRLTQQCLNPGGIFCQWVPYHGLSPAQHRAILRTFQSVFAHATLWSLDESYALLLATPQPLKIDFNSLARRLLRRPLRDEMRQVDLEDPFFLLSHFALDSDALTGLTSGETTLLSDNRPAQLFFPPRASLAEQYQQWPAANRQAIAAHAVSVLPLLSGIEGDPRLAERMRYVEAMRRAGRR